MDSYALSFTLPHPFGSHASIAESGPPHSADVETAVDQSGPNSIATSPVQGLTQAPIQPPAAPSTAQPTTGRLGSMRSRFPPSVKAFMPSAFGGKRTNDRIAEVTVSGEKEDDAADGTETTSRQATTNGATTTLGRTSSEWRKMKLTSTSSLPLSVPEEGSDKGGAPGRGSTTNDRELTKDTATRSSLDFSATANLPSADSSLNSFAAGGVTTRGEHRGVREDSGTHQYDRQNSPDSPPTISHSKSNSIASLGVQQPLTTLDLAQATVGLTLHISNSLKVLISSTIAQEDARSSGSAAGHTSASSASSVSNWPSSAASPYSPYSPFGISGHRQVQQLPFPEAGPDSQGKGNYPYQQYAQGFGHDVTGVYNGIPFPAMSSNGNFGSTTSLGSTLAQQQQQQPALNGLLGPSVSTDSKSIQSKSNKMPRYNFVISGTMQQVLDARTMVMLDHPFRCQVSVKVPRADFIEPLAGMTAGSDNLKEHIRQRLDEIASATSTRIVVVGKDARGADLGYGLEAERNVELLISGQLQGIEFARIRILVLLDGLIGLTSTTCEIDQKFHNIIGGRKRGVIQSIQEQTSTSIYLPLPLGSEVGGAGVSLGVSSLQNTIYITGEFFGVQRAREMLWQVFLHKSKCTISRDTHMLPRKIDWLLADHLEDVRQIMIDNGTYIGLPPLGSQGTLLSVYGDNRVSIERSLRAIMTLMYQFYIAAIWLLPPAGAYHGATPSVNIVNPAHVGPYLKAIVDKSGAEISFRDNQFEIFGVEAEVKQAVNLVLDLDFVKQFAIETHFQIELAITERDFLQGRKCGKINKIMKTCGVRIKFEALNDFNFLIDLSGGDRAGVMQGLALLQEELPAEVSFHVPEAYHKRCIGVGGKQIQKVMKKYGVYVKFSNADEFAALGGYIDNDDNVIARTPAKNAINLENLKQSVMEMVNPKDKEYMTETVSIARRHHRALLSEKAIFVHDIENKCSSKIYFPPRETCSDLVSIFGPEMQIHTASAMLLEHVPFEAEFRIPNAPSLPQVLGSQEFVAFVERIRRDLSISIAAVPTPSGVQEAIFKLSLNRSNHDFLPTAKDLLEDFLISRSVSVYPPPARARSDSFASSFPHFATKLISAPGAETGTGASAINDSGNLHFQAELAARFNEGGKLRAAASSPALKALFDSPANLTGSTARGLGHHASQSFAIGGGGGAGTNGGSARGATVGPLAGPLDAPGLALGNGLGNGIGTGLGNGVGTGLRSTTLGASANAPHPGHSPVIGSSLYTSPYGDAMPGGVSSGVWGVTPRQTTLSSATAPVGSGIAFPRQSPFSHQSAASAQFPGTGLQSDDFGARSVNGHARGPVDVYDFDDATRDNRTSIPAHQNRTQSLDVSKLSAQQAVADANSYFHQQYGGGQATGSGFRPRGAATPGGPAYGLPPPFGASYTYHSPAAVGQGRGHSPANSISRHSPANSISRLPHSITNGPQAPDHTVDEVSRIMNGLTFPTR